MKRLIHVASVAALLIALDMPCAIAQPTEDPAVAARALYDRGLRHYNVGEYAQAIDAWKEAYKLSHAPLLLFNIGQAHRLSGDCTNAMRFYASYRRELPSPPNAAEVDAAEALCASTPAGNDDIVGSGTGTGTVTGTATGSGSGSDSGSDSGSVSGSVSSASTHVAHSDTGRNRRIAGMALGGTGVVAALAGGYFLRSAAAASSDIEAAQGEWTAALDEREAHGRRDQMIGFAAVGAGTVLVATGAVFYILGHRASSVEIAPTNGGATVALRAHF